MILSSLDTNKTNINLNKHPHNRMSTKLNIVHSDVVLQELQVYNI